MTKQTLQAKAGAEWWGSPELQRTYPTPEFYWWERYQRVYCPDCRADERLLHDARPVPFGRRGASIH
jgi:hypothetical protein